MKNTNQLILISILILIISAIAITYFYISNHLLSQVSDIETGSVVAIFLQIGLVGSLIPTTAFLLLAFIKNTVKTASTRYLFYFILTAAVVFTVYYFVLYMTFHKFATPIKFSQPIGLL